MRKRKDYAGDYPDNWPIISLGAKRNAGWKCEHCGMEFYPDGKAKESVNADGKPAILTVHHIDGNKMNNRSDNLLVCCQKCHLHVQAAWRPGLELPALWRRAPRWMVRRRLPYKPSRQLSFLGDDSAS